MNVRIIMSHTSPSVTRLILLVFLIILLTGAAAIQATGDSIQVVSVSSAAVRGDLRSGYWGAAISADSSTIVFTSDANNLIPDDSNHVGDIFVYERLTGLTSRVNLDSSGQEAASFASYNPSISSNGRYVTFQSSASNLVSGDTNYRSDIFVRDRTTGVTSRVSVDSSGQEGNDGSEFPSISANGQAVVFESLAANLVAGDSNAVRDVFLHDLQSGQTLRVSVGDSGQQGNDASWLGVNPVSADGRYVVFESRASNLAAGDNNGSSDVFVFDRQSGHSSRVSLGMGGQESDGDSSRPSISANGRYIVYKSTADNLVAEDTNTVGDIFVYDVQTGETSRASTASDGQEANATSGNLSISADGRFVTFQSSANNLVSGDNNAHADIFVHDTVTGETIRVSVNNGLQSDEDSSFPAISGDGEYVTFVSASNALIPVTANPFHEEVFLAANPLAAIVLHPDPTDAAPARNSFTALPITLTWTGDANTRLYQVQVDTSGLFSAPQIFTTDGARYVTIDSLPDGTYYWRVRAQNSDWSQTETFVLDTSP